MILQAGLLYEATPIIGCAYGGIFALGVALFSDLYKLKKNTGTIYAFYSLSAALGSFLFSQQLFPWAYDRYSGGSNDCVEGKRCGASLQSPSSLIYLCVTGIKCFRDAALISAASLVFAAVLIFLLMLRTRTMYRSMAS